MILHPSKYIRHARIERKCRPKQLRDLERVYREINEVANAERLALTKKHGRKITGEATIRIVGFNRVRMNVAFAFYDQ